MVRRHASMPDECDRGEVGVPSRRSSASVMIPEDDQMTKHTWSSTAPTIREDRPLRFH
jgi:hypothetical protein